MLTGLKLIANYWNISQYSTEVIFIYFMIAVNSDKRTNIQFLKIIRHGVIIYKLWETKIIIIVVVIKLLVVKIMLTLVKIEI